MKIGMLVNNLEVSGGYQKLVIRLSQALEKKGHAVTIYSPSVNKKDCYPDDIKTLTIVTNKRSATGASLEDKMSSLAELVDTSVDLLIIHDPDCLTTLQKLKAAEMPKVIWMLNNQLPESLFTPFQAWKESLKRTRALNPYARLKIAFVESRHQNKVWREATKLVDVFATYDTLNKQLVEDNLGREATIVFAGADLEAFMKLKRPNRTSKLTHIKLLSVGVAFPHRRYEDLIETVAQLKKTNSVELTIVGRQDLHPEYANILKNLVKEKNVQKEITFIEYAPQAQLMQLYKDCDAFLFVNDGFTWGISVFEAVAAKIPVIITNNIGASDLITNNKTGWVVNPRSPREIAKAVEEIANNPDQVKQLCTAAYLEIEDLLTWDAYAERLLETVQ